MKVVPISLVSVLLTGCSADQQRQFFECRLEAIKAYPDDDGGPWSKQSYYIQACMGAAGYQIASRGEVGAMVATYCTPWARERILMEECYAPTNWLSRWARYTEAELWGK